MTIKMLVFDYKESEQKFFAENNFQNYDIKFFSHSLNKETFNELSEEEKFQTSVISVYSDSMLTEEILNGFKNLRTIATRANHWDNVNRKTCIKKHIAVLNIQNYGKTSVAEFTIGLILSLIRKIPQAVDGIKNQTYMNESYVGKEFKNMTLGIIGVGAVGSEVCRLSSAFGTKILACDICPKKEMEHKYNIEYVSMENLLKNSDIVTLHLPYNGMNYHMFGKQQFEQMKKGSYFINVSQGELINHSDLKMFLENGKLAGAALDVVSCRTECEKCQKISDKLEETSLLCLQDSRIIRELSHMPNVIITPQIATETKDAIHHILNETFYALQDQLRGGNSHQVI